jgi:hypothetical protein
MGAGIALQSAGIDPRMEAVVAEAPFASLPEASYDYAGLQDTRCSARHSSRRARG